MTEIKKTLTILKARWPEVVLIIGVNLLAILSSRFIAKFGSKSIRTIAYVVPLVSLLFSVIRMLLRCGFLRTTYLENSRRQTPLALLRTGTHFFWRMFVISLIYSLPFMLLSLVFTWSVYNYFGCDKMTSSHIIFWFSTLFFVFVNLVLIKLILLIPALIIVLDCSVFNSFRLFRRYKLSNAKELVFLYLANIAIGLLWSGLSFYSWGGTCSTMQSQYALRIVVLLITSFINLMIAVMAVRFVASKNLVYDNQPAEDLSKRTDGNLKE